MGFLLGNGGVDPGAITGPSSGQVQTSQQLQALYKKFLDQQPTMAQDLYNNAQEQTAQNLQQQEQGIRAGANQRGLLYSGIREGAEGQAAAGAASNLANQRANINSGLEQQGNRYGQMAFGSGMDIANQALQREQARYNIAMGNAQQQNNSIGGLLGAAGMAGGYAAAGGFGGGNNSLTPSAQKPYAPYYGGDSNSNFALGGGGRNLSMSSF